jgi:membrane protein required for colicin V production
MHLGNLTFLDFVIVTIILVSTAFALRKGLMREIISLVSLIAGLLLAANYYPVTAHWFIDLAKTDSVANLIGFLIIFTAVIATGAIVSFIVNRFIKMAALQWVDRLMGAVFGLLRGWIIASIMALAFISFPVRQDSLTRSVFTPYLLAGARAAALLVPQHLKVQFNEQYQKILESWNK